MEITESDKPVYSSLQLDSINICQCLTVRYQCCSLQIAGDDGIAGDDSFADSLANHDLMIYNNNLISKC